MRAVDPAIFINEFEERDDAMGYADILRELEPKVEFRVIPYYNNKFALFAGSREAIRERLAQ